MDINIWWFYTFAPTSWAMMYFNVSHYLRTNHYIINLRWIRITLYELIQKISIKEYEKCNAVRFSISSHQKNKNQHKNKNDNKSTNTKLFYQEQCERHNFYILGSKSFPKMIVFNQMDVVCQRKNFWKKYEKDILKDDQKSDSLWLRFSAIVKLVFR